jgi:hypothetical protein
VAFRLNGHWASFPKISGPTARKGFVKLDTQSVNDPCLVFSKRLAWQVWGTARRLHHPWRQILQNASGRTRMNAGGKRRFAVASAGLKASDGCDLGALETAVEG